MKCPFCDSEISDSSLFCTFCGAKINTEGSIPVDTRMKEDSEYVKKQQRPANVVFIILRGLVSGVKGILSLIVSVLILVLVFAPFTGKLDGIFEGAYGSVNHNPDLVTRKDISDAIKGDSRELKRKLGFAVSDERRSSDEKPEIGLTKELPKESKNDVTTIESKEELTTGLSTIRLGGYEITTPDYYDFVSSEEIDGRIQHYEFRNKYNSRDYFTIDILEKGEETPADLVRDSEYWMEYDLGNGARLEEGIISVGEFEGIMAVYDNDNPNDYRISAFLVNDRDRCIFILYGMSDPMNVLEHVGIFEL